MSFSRSLISKFFATSNNKRPVRDSRNLRTASSQYQTLEERRVLASIFFDAAAGDLYISGGSGADTGSITTVAGGQVEASVTGSVSKTYSAASISRVVFIGGDGNDTFTNGTSIASLLIGGDGNDVLNGGSGDDVINAGRGNDTGFGNAGNDRLVGFLGNDELRGGDGNDRIFGSDGANFLYGDAGDDVIYGGDDVDTAFGGDGRDEIYGLDGDDILSAGDGGVAGTAGISQADFVMGLGGNDTFVGGNGLNVFWGGDGNDTFTGGLNAENRMHGQLGDDTMTGGNSFDYIANHEGDDIIDGLGGSDYIVAGAGDDSINGGSGNDQVVFTGIYDNYRINGDSSLRVRDLRDADSQGNNETSQVETFTFFDGERTPEISSVQQAFVRPIVVSNNNGSNTATFFGDAATEVEIKERVDDIFAQAKVDIVWQADVSYNNTFANQGTATTRPRSDLNTIVDNGDAAGVGSSNSNVMDAYFVQRAAGFGTVGDNSANGLAFVGASGTTIHVGDNLLTFDDGLNVIARVVAHELAHNLGLDHVSASANLMDISGSDGENLTTAQISTILNSSITQTI
jgi:Ca2+-binding RTX toxin-like protein